MTFARRLGVGVRSPTVQPGPATNHAVVSVREGPGGSAASRLARHGARKPKESCGDRTLLRACCFHDLVAFPSLHHATRLLQPDLKSHNLPILIHLKLEGHCFTVKDLDLRGIDKPAFALFPNQLFRRLKTRVPAVSQGRPRSLAALLPTETSRQSTIPVWWSHPRFSPFAQALLGSDQPGILPNSIPHRQAVKFSLSPVLVSPSPRRTTGGEPAKS